MVNPKAELMPWSVLGVVVAALLSGCSTTGHATDNAQNDDAVAEQWFQASFKAGPGQDLSRLSQDEAQKLCSQYRASPPQSVAAAIEAAEKKSVVYPADGKLVGDWKLGARIFDGGFGYRIGSFIPSNPAAVRGGNCYACHQGEAKESAFGNLGSSLQHYGKIRGQSEAVVKYTYEKIYNAKAFNACSSMPRLGHNKILSPEQIANVVAYLISPESPINK